jgi:hypothetical protein
MATETLSEQWGGLHASTISIRIRQSRNLRKMPLAEFDRRIDEVIDAEQHAYEQKHSLPTESYWLASAIVLDVTTSWIVRGIPCSEDDIKASRTPF